MEDHRMMRWVRVTWLGLVCALAVSGVAAAQGPTNVKALIAGLEDGTIRGSNLPHAQHSVKWGRAVGIIDAPLADVLAVVQNYAGYYTFMPHFRVSKVLSQRGTSALVYMQASIAANTMNLWAQMKVGPRPNEGDTRVIEGKMVDGNMDAMMARWEVTPIDPNRTLVAFQLLMDPKLPLPDSFVSSENEIATRKTIRALRQVLAERKQKSSPAKH
jgi:ribosome-associated toxin RatA of RatAB toxin-antitoxin module